MSSKQLDKADIRGFFGKGPKDDPKPASKMVVLDSSDMVIVDSDSENDKANYGETKLQGRSVKKRDWISILIAFANNPVNPFSRLQITKEVCQGEQRCGTCVGGIKPPCFGLQEKRRRVPRRHRDY